MSVSEIIRVAARGEGVTADGRHIPFAAPGDQVGEDGAITAGPHRAVPPCRHFPECGGCQLQHLDDAAYADFVRDRVVGALAAQGLASDVRPAIVSPPRTRRRATLHGERAGKQVLLGFAQAASHRVIDLAECHILAPELFALVAPLRALLAATLPTGRRADVHVALCDQGVDVVIKGLSADTLASAEALTGFARRQGLARLSLDDGLGAEPRWEPDEVTVTLGGVAVPLPPGAFLQATPEGEAVLVAAVQAIVGTPRTVADLFTGLGTFGLALGPQTRVYAAEAGREAILALKGAAARAGRALFADHRDLFRRPLSAEEAGRFDAIILDPPRAGARDQAAELAKATTPRIAYVSCNPSSFARDVKTMCEGGYVLDWVQPVGQFRWSTHVELVGCLSRWTDSPRAGNTIHRAAH
ncbi:class I SAM-dependent RNA methyltransferase [Sphingomonas japonica]|uniref:23S rRNA (Uracil1939-C5)-methyltransferase n=1 Tax=Sphingomonas japonica TaxID=511662 RepID=A0ABX0U747_9SPHN|nr:class I SAM-dependent RNA methyltransferase [Sphingomonas japonica]NIJ25062.1 23S rRNA (uracil1939-C5)-methyltransferase [Sphingomonas japonica]